jgi:uncharacterized protein
MILDIRTIPPGHSELSQSADLEALKADLPPFSRKISCRAQIDSSGSDFFVHLEFEGIFELECSRCLKHFCVPIKGDMRLVVKEQPGKFGPALDDESVDFYYDSRHFQVDLSPAIYDEIMTALPLKPLCSEDCMGIELRDEQISVGPEAQLKKKDEIDPRWEALKKLTIDKGKK